MNVFVQNLNEVVLLNCVFELCVYVKTKLNHLPKKACKKSENILELIDKAIFDVCVSCVFVTKYILLVSEN